MSFWEPFRRAVEALLPRGTADPQHWVELSGRLFAFLLFAGFLYLVRALLRRLSDLAFNRFGPKVRRLVAWFWNLLYWTLLIAAASAIFEVGRPSWVLLAGLKLTVAYLSWIAVELGIEHYLERRGVDPNLVVLVRYLALLLLVSWTAYMIAGREIAPLIGALGIVGLAVSLAAQDTFSNFIAGVVLLLDRPFHIGDWVRIGDKLGQIERITLRTTRIRTLDNEQIAIPNAQVAKDEIQNLSAGGPLRIHVPVGVAYRHTADEVRPVLLGVAEGHPALLKDPAPEVWLVGLGDSSVDFEIVAWIPEHEIRRLPKIAAELTEAAKKALDAAGIEIPFPQRTLWFAEPLRVVQESASQSDETTE